MKGRIWLLLGAAVGIAVAFGHLPYLAGAGRSLADTAERLVNSGGQHLIRAVASAGAPRRVVLVLTALMGALLPGLAALGLVVAARGTMRLRAVVGLLIVALGVASYAYQPGGKATGVLALALVAAAAAVFLTGPLVAAPLSGVAGLLGGEFLPRLLSSKQTVTESSVENLHIALYNHPGNPAALQVAVLVIAVVPFAFAARYILRR